MSNAIIGALRVDLGLDTAVFSTGLAEAQKALRTAGQRMQAMGQQFQNIGAGLSAAVTLPLIGLGAVAVGEASEMRDALGQVDAALTSMGDVAGRSLDQLKASADALAGSSLFEDDQILRNVTANMLTFGNIAGDTFDRAQQAVVDLATRMNMDLQSATVLLGKALNDPVNSLSALGRTGAVTKDFIAANQDRVAAMVREGNVAGAQALILGELERQYKGSAAAARENAAPLEKVNLAFKNMAGSIGEILLPALDRVASLFEGFAAKFGQMSAPMQQFTVIAGVVAAALGPVLVALGSLISAAGAISAAFATGGGLAFLLPFLGPIALGVGAVTAAFVLWGDDIIPMIQAFGQQLAEVLGPKVQPLLEAFKGLVSSVGEVFGSIFGAGGALPVDLQLVGEVIARIFGAAVDLITGAINVITNVMRALGALLRGDFSAMWSALGSAVGALVSGVLNAFETLFPGVISSVRNLAEGVRTWLIGRLGDAMSWVIDKVRAVGDAFFKLYDAVVGHSYIPDMVDEIGEHVRRLQGNMVAPIDAMTAEAAGSFAAMSDNIGSTIDGLLKSLGSKDWAGVLGGISELFGQFGGSRAKPFADLGKSIADLFSGGGTGGLSSVLSSLKTALPGFKDGGTFRPATSGGIQ